MQVAFNQKNYIFVSTNYFTCTEINCATKENFTLTE